MPRAALLFALCSGSAAAASFTDVLWEGAQPLYAQMLEHPFLRGLSDGSLPRSRFEFYLIQDLHYLRKFARALNVAAAKSPREDWAAILRQHAEDALHAERELHEDLLASYGVSSNQVEGAGVAPSNYAYTNHLLAVAQERPFAEGLAALLPCYWIYWEVGKELQKQGSPKADYQRWIDQYASEEFGEAVEQVLEMMNIEAGRLDANARARVKKLFQISTRYEWMFWDMAWRQEQWPPERR